MTSYPDGQPRSPPTIQTRALLNAYAELLDAAAGRPLGRWHVRRFGVGVDRCLVEHMRGTLDALQRRYRLRAAVGSRDDGVEQEDARLIREFAASLPPPPSRLQILWPVLLVLIVVQFLLDVVPSRLLSLIQPYESTQVDTGGLVTALRDLTDLNLSSVVKVTDLLFHKDVLTVCLVLATVCVAGYVVLRPWATGLLVSRAVLDPAVAAHWRTAPRALRSLAVALRVAEREDEAFKRVDASCPRHRSLDVFVRALLAGAFALVAVVLVSSYDQGVTTALFSQSTTCCGEWVQGVTTIAQPPPLLIAALAAGAVSAGRLCWLAREYRRRNPTPVLLIAHGRARSISRPTWRSVGWVTLAALFMTAALVVYTAPEHRRPTIILSAPDGFAPAMTTRRRLPVEVGCDEPCHLRSAKLRRIDSQPAPPHANVLITGQRHLRRPRDPYLANFQDMRQIAGFPANVRPQIAATLQLSLRQTRWLRTQLKRRHDGLAQLELNVVDAHDNRTKGYLFTLGYR